MKRRLLRAGAIAAVAAVMCALAVPVSASAGPVFQLPIDVRTAGMGLTYVGVLGEPGPGSANPASFGFDVDKSALLAGGTLAAGGAGLSGYVAIRDIDRGAGGGGLSFTYCRGAEGEGHGLHGTYQVGKALTDWLALGLGIACSTSALGEGADPTYVLTSEAGAVVRLGPLRLGAVVSGISATTFVPEEDVSTVFAPTLSAGLALQTEGGITLAFDAHDMVSTAEGIGRWYSGGAEVRLGSKQAPGSAFALRAGVAFGGDLGVDKPSYTGGIGFDSGEFSIGYAVIAGGDGPVVHCIGLGGSF